MSYVENYVLDPVEQRVRTFKVIVRGSVDTTTRPEAERVHAEIAGDWRTGYLSSIMDSEIGPGYTMNFTMLCPCSYTENAWVATPPYEDWSSHLVDPLPRHCEIEDYQILRD